MFGSVGETIDSVCKFVLANVESEQFRNGSPYYESPIAFTYAFSRAYADVKTTSKRAADQAVAALERERRYLQDTY